MTKIGTCTKKERSIFSSMDNKKRLIELLREAKVKKGLYTSDGEVVEFYLVRAVDDNVVGYLADYLIANGVTLVKESDT